MADLQPEKEPSNDRRENRQNYASDPLLGSLFENAGFVFTYTRADALADGALVDVSEVAREAGFAVPVAVSAALWADIQAAQGTQVTQTTQANSLMTEQDVTGRLWDVLFMAWHNIRVHGHEAGDTLVYELILPVVSGADEPALDEHGAAQYPRYPKYTVKSVIGPGDAGEPVLTLMRPDED